MQPDLRFIRTLQSPHHVVKDGQTGRYRISSKAFSPSSSDGKLSGDLEQLLQEDGLHATAMYPAVSGAVAAAAISVGRIRDAGATVEQDPVCRNWYHGAVGDISSSKKLSCTKRRPRSSRSIRMRLLDCTRSGIRPGVHWRRSMDVPSLRCHPKRRPSGPSRLFDGGTRFADFDSVGWLEDCRQLVAQASRFSPG